jgi:hypothetical protein
VGGATTLSISLSVGIVVIVLLVVGAARVLAKAGYSKWWVLSLLFPVLAIILALVFAFATWPATRELELLRGQASSTFVGPHEQAHHLEPWTDVTGTPTGPATFPTAGQATGPWAAGVGPGTAYPVSERDPLPPFGHAVLPLPHEADLPEGGGPAVPFVHHDDHPDHPPAGWYAVGEGQRRYWDGRAWTDNFA